VVSIGYCGDEVAVSSIFNHPEDYAQKNVVLKGVIDLQENDILLVAEQDEISKIRLNQ